MKLSFPGLLLSELLPHTSAWGPSRPVSALLRTPGPGPQGPQNPGASISFLPHPGPGEGQKAHSPEQDAGRETPGAPAGGGGGAGASLLSLDPSCTVVRPAPRAFLLIQNEPSPLPAHRNSVSVVEAAGDAVIDTAAPPLHQLEAGASEGDPEDLQDMGPLQECRSFLVQCPSLEVATQLQAALEEWRATAALSAYSTGSAGKGQGVKVEEGSNITTTSTENKNNSNSNSNGNKDRSSDANGVFDAKIEASSAKMYFHYYGQLLHQQNMLQDYVRTGTYYAAVLENKVDFDGKVVVDVGAGSGILSLFAAKAGARRVYAIEASSMANYAAKLAAGNPAIGAAVTTVHGKVEDVTLPEKADILISEPMGTLLVNERMLETYIIARDRFLKPGGKMFPGLGRIHVAPFSDEYLYVEMANKALFWQQRSYYGVDLMPLHHEALRGYFAQPVVDAFDPRILIAPSIFHSIDFTTVKENDLYEIDIPLNFRASMAARVHGLACWFDVLFEGSMVQRWLTTAPGSPTTHWYQLRCVLSQPLYVFAGQLITGRLHLVAHKAQSFTIFLTMSTHAWSPPGTVGSVLQTATGKLDLKEPYYRISQASLSWTQEQPLVQPTGAAQQQQQQQHQQHGQQQQQQQEPQQQGPEPGGSQMQGEASRHSSEMMSPDDEAVGMEDEHLQQQRLQQQAAAFQQLILQHQHQQDQQQNPDFPGAGVAAVEGNSAEQGQAQGGAQQQFFGAGVTGGAQVWPPSHG